MEVVNWKEQIFKADEQSEAQPAEQPDEQPEEQPEERPEEQTCISYSQGHVSNMHDKIEKFRNKKRFFREPI